MANANEFRVVPFGPVSDEDVAASEAIMRLLLPRIWQEYQNLGAPEHVAVLVFFDETEAYFSIQSVKTP